MSEEGCLSEPGYYEAVEGTEHTPGDYSIVTVLTSKLRCKVFWPVVGNTKSIISMASYSSTTVHCRGRSSSVSAARYSSDSSTASGHLHPQQLHGHCWVWSSLGFATAALALLPARFLATAYFAAAAVCLLVGFAVAMGIGLIRPPGAALPNCCLRLATG